MRVLKTNTPELFGQAVREAAALLRAGDAVALPTETVYGLAANALNEQAVARIFEIKGRPAHNPIIVHVASLAMARRCVLRWPALAQRLARAFWPGPLTLVLPRAPVIPAIVTAGGPTVGVRWPSHPFIQAVIQECGFPIAAPSANPFGQISPTTAEHVCQSLGQRIALIIDGGPAPVGIESTVLDLSVRPPRILRPGMIHAESVLAVTGPQRGRPSGRETEGAGPYLKSPGQLPKHYSPRARLLIFSWQDEADLQQQIRHHRISPARAHLITHRHIPSRTDYGRVVVLPHNAQAYARAIYAELHRADEAGADFIIVEALPATPEWRAIADRLQRAAR